MKPGFKQTEVGVIPEDWRTTTLGASCATVTKGTTPTSIGREFTSAGVTFLKAESISISGRALPEQVAFIHESTHALLRRSQLAPGDLLVSIAGVLGRVGYVHADDLPANINQALAIVRLSKQSDLDRFYTFHCLRSPVIGKQIRDISVQAAQANISLQNVREFRVPVPPLLEQEAIASVLGDADALIESLERLAAKKRDVKQGAMQELLTGKRRLPGFTGKWETRKLDDLCSMKSGEGITSPDIDDMSPFPCYGGNGLRGYARRHTHKGDYALIGRVGALCGNVRFVQGLFFASEHAIVVTPHSDTDIRWLTYILSDMDLNQYAESSAQPVLTVTKLNVLSVVGPTTSSEQAAIAAVLSDMDAELAALEAKLSKARAIKQGMMQELLTGRIRLK